MRYKSAGAGPRRSCEAFSPAIVGTALGTAALLSSRGMALRPLIGGGLYDLYDRYGRYTWLYTGLAAAAAAIAMLFASARRPRARDELKQALQR